ncbi:MAG TPA: class A beta-lactamase [Polyangiaceae bacterium]|nr:class A beta-lactamase [Polyangiaceae bacterium]
MLTRRLFMAASLFFATSAGCKRTSQGPAANSELPFGEALRRLETAAQGKLGVYVIDTASGREFGHRADERFSMLSTFKLLASAYVLARVDRAEESLPRRVQYTRQDLVDWSPVTEKHLEQGELSLEELCHAAMTTSDNTAANLILRSFGGPPALTRFVRTLGDDVTRTDRFETELNTPSNQEPLDTTTPRAMARTIHRLVLGDVLSPKSREILQSWLLANTTGLKRLRAGLPASWKLGEKTGTTPRATHDVGVAWPPAHAPVVVTTYLASDTAANDVREQTLAEVGRLLPALIRAT